LKEAGVKYVEVEDEAAFYGPKVDVQFKSVIGREESMSTVQLDFAAKERFGLSYTDESGKANDEVFVIHRAPLSTHERFTAFLIEHYAGNWPVWMSPVQVMISPVGSKHVDGAREIAKEFLAAGVIESPGLIADLDAVLAHLQRFAAQAHDDLLFSYGQSAAVCVHVGQGIGKGYVRRKEDGRGRLVPAEGQIGAAFGDAAAEGPGGEGGLGHRHES